MRLLLLFLGACVLLWIVRRALPWDPELGPDTGNDDWSTLVDRCPPA